jgi:hypothetical protein
MPLDEQGRPYEPLDAFFARTDPATRPPDTSPENVVRAVRYLEAWLPVGAPALGSAAQGDIRTLMAFARDQLGLDS